MAKPRVLVDTCIIIEAFRTSCWAALCDRYAVETVEKCIEEACTGDPFNPSRIVVDHTELVNGLAQRHAYDDEHMATLAIDHEELLGLDAGELHIMAWLHGNRPVPITLLISTTDKAALSATHALGLLDQTQSLEEMVRAAGVGQAQLRSLSEHFGEKWLTKNRTQIVLNAMK